jgi:hypothetical protein
LSSPPPQPTAPSESPAATRRRASVRTGEFYRLLGEA